MHNSSQYQSVIQALNECYAVCEHCSTACLQEEDVKMMVRCIMLDRDCAELCRLTAGILARGSELAKTFLQACAEVCSACAEECSKHQSQHCQECAESCRRCAEACQGAIQ